MHPCRIICRAAVQKVAEELQVYECRFEGEIDDASKLPVPAILPAALL